MTFKLHYYNNKYNYHELLGKAQLSLGKYTTQLGGKTCRVYLRIAFLALSSALWASMGKFY